MIENENNKLDTSKKRVRRGQFHSTRTGLIRGGDYKARSFNMEELNFQGVDIAVGLIGQITVETDGTPSTGSDPVMTLNAFGGDVQTIGDISPSADNTYLCGHAARAWQFVVSNNAFQNVSDERTKKDIVDLEYGLKEIQKLRPVSFKRKSDKTERTQLGLIAQELRTVLPESVWGSEDQLYTVGYETIIPVLINAVKELSAEVETLKAQRK